ncbi:hypothetical protein D9M68_500100 [compost metagenome]
MVDQAGGGGVEFAAGDAGAEQAVGIGRIGGCIGAQQRVQPRPFTRLRERAELHFAPHDVERVRGHARMERDLPFGGRHHLLAQEGGNGLEQFGDVGAVLHQAASSSGASKASRSDSASDARRPMAAFSTSRSRPLSQACTMASQTMPHLSVPSTSHQRTRSASI